MSPFKALETTIKKQDDEIERLKNTQKVIKPIKVKSCHQETFLLSGRAVSFDSLYDSFNSSHDSLLTAYFLSGRAVDPRHGAHQPAEAGGVPDERGEGQGQEALRAQVSP